MGYRVPPRDIQGDTAGIPRDTAGHRGTLRGGTSQDTAGHPAGHRGTFRGTPVDFCGPCGISGLRKLSGFSGLLVEF